MKRKNPLVSVIIPTRNRFKLLKRSIGSVLGQSYKNMEVIIIDDASIDKTSELIKKIKDKRVKFIRFKKHQGAAKARNAGLKKAKGELIAFNDDDDLWHEKKLEKQIKAFRNASEKIGVVYTRMKRTDGRKAKYFPDEVVGEEGKKEGEIQRELYLENFVGLPTAVVKKECFEKVGLFDEKLPCYEDWELFLRISQRFHFKCLPQILIEAPILLTGLTSKRKVVLKASEIIFQKHQQAIKKNKRILAAWQFRLGDLYYHQRNMEKARQFFVQALKNSPSFRYCRAIVKTFLGKRTSETLIDFKTQLTSHWQLGGILFLALILRLINLNQSLWLDEAVRAITSQGSFSGIFQGLGGDFHPPLYRFLIWLWVHLFGSGEVILRLPSVIFGVATVWIVYLIAKKFLSEKFSIIAALLMATAPFHIYYSQEARNYALTTLLASLSFYFFTKLKQRSRKETFGYLFSTTFLLYANYFGLFILLAQALVVLWQKKWQRLKLISCCLFLFTPNLVLLKTQLLTGRQATTALPEWGRLVNLGFFKALPLTFVKFSIGRITIFNKIIYAAVAGILFLIYGAIIARGLVNKKKPLILLSWFAIPIFCAWIISLFVPNYQPFRLLLVLPAFYLLLVWGISRVRTEIMQIILVFFILFVNLITTSIYYTNSYFHREDWRGLVQFIESPSEEKRVVILPSQTSNWPYKYYSKEKVPLVSLSEGFQTVKEKDLDLRLSPYSEATIYYIRYLVPMFDSQEETVSWLNQNGFVKIKEISFNQIPLWVYEPL